MIVNRTFMDQAWTDLSSPTKDEIDSLVLSQNISPLVAKDLLIPTPSQYARRFDNTIYAVMHIPFFRHSHSVYSEQEIDFVITEKSLITTRYESIDALHNFSKQIEVAEILNKENNSHLFFGLMHEVYKFILEDVSYIQDQIKEIEKNIFSGYEKEMVLNISGAARKLLAIKRTIGPHEMVWSELKEEGGATFGPPFKKDASLLLEEWRRIILLTDNTFEILDELRETNNSILSTKQNEVMKTFTILAFVTFPLSLVASIFGMNTSFIPIVGSTYDFWIVVGIMATMSLAMFTFFKYKKWI